MQASYEVDGRAFLGESDGGDDGAPRVTEDENAARFGGGDVAVFGYTAAVAVARDER